VFFVVLVQRCVFRRLVRQHLIVSCCGARLVPIERSTSINNLGVEVADPKA